MTGLRCHRATDRRVAAYSGRAVRVPRSSVLTSNRCWCVHRAASKRPATTRTMSPLRGSQHEVELMTDVTFAWREIRAAYANLGVSELCLDLQDRFGVDVP